MQEVSGLDDLGVLRAAMTRAKNREGVPMVVALIDERPDAASPAAVAADIRADGAGLAAQLAGIRSRLAPTIPSADNGAVISALVVAAHSLTAGPTQ